MAWLNKFQEGGAVAPQEQAQAGGEDQAMQQLVALVQAALQGDQQANQQIQQIMQAAQQGDQQAMQLALAIQQIAQELQGQAQMAKDGAKLSYIHSLRCGNKVEKDYHGNLIDPSTMGGPIFRPGDENKLSEWINAVYQKYPKVFDALGINPSNATDASKAAFIAKTKARKEAIANYKPDYSHGEIQSTIQRGPIFDDTRRSVKNAQDVTHNSKGGKVCSCGAKLHKLGGRLVNVDCNGNIIG